MSYIHMCRLIKPQGDCSLPREFSLRTVVEWERTKEFAIHTLDELESLEDLQYER